MRKGPSHFKSACHPRRATTAAITRTCEMCCLELLPQWLPWSTRSMSCASSSWLAKAAPAAALFHGRDKGALGEFESEWPPLPRIIKKRERHVDRTCPFYSFRQFRSARLRGACCHRRPRYRAPSRCNGRAFRSESYDRTSGGGLAAQNNFQSPLRLPLDDRKSRRFHRSLRGSRRQLDFGAPGSLRTPESHPPPDRNARMRTCRSYQSCDASAYAR